MDIEQLTSYQQTLLNQALVEGIKRNEKQIKIWTKYKNGHEKLIQGLETLPLELTTNCMVPIGKRALIKGKLTHTNEILVCLGDGYFAKYTAAQAIALCNRRIKQADEMLKNLEKERSLYEMRQILPLDQDVFGNEERPNLYEHWEEKKVEDWKVEHRQREKEYRQKQKQLKSQEEADIQTEEDLFRRLDELELKEELEDEINRLEAENYNILDEEMEESDYSSESSDEESLLREEMNELLEQQLAKLKAAQARRNLLESSKGPNPHTDKEEESRISTNECVNLNSNAASTILGVEAKDQNLNFNELPNKETTDQTTEELTKTSEIQPNPHESLKCKTECSSELLLQSSLDKNVTIEELSERPSTRERKVSFAEPHHIEIDSDIEVNSPRFDEQTLSFDEQRLQDSEYKYKEDDEENVIRIDFTHSNNNPEIHLGENDTIKSPKDFYRLFCKPKSILKRSPDDMRHCKFPPVIDYDSMEEEEDEEEDEEESVKGSIYTAVVKDVQERNPDMPNVTESASAERPISRFKMSRSELYK